jgi:serine/threonine-protein kinase
MGSVWAARNELTDRDFAIKFLHPKLADNKEALNRFFLEARACGQIKHPAVVDVYDMGQAEDGSPYLVMELLEGEGFDQRLGRAGVFRPGEAAAWIAFVARGLEEAHVRGLVHRDLKPGNIFFALDDRGDVIPKVLDFGVSKATGNNDELLKTSTGTVLGSPAYMSPEQMSGEVDVDTRSDVWSLGVVLYEALTGKVPFDAANYNALMVAILTQPHRPVCEVAPGVPVELSQVVDQALAKDRTQRIGTARELADRLEAVAIRITDSPLPVYGMRVPTLVGGPTPLPARSTTQASWSGEETATAQRRSGMTLLAVGLLSAAALLGGVMVFLQMRPPLVAVAGRSSVALAQNLSRLHAELSQVQAEAQADERARAQQAPTSIAFTPDELPPARPTPAAPTASATSGSPAAPPATSKPAVVPHKGKGPGGKGAPSGGVDGPGF